jgi:hypothetical protein
MRRRSTRRATRRGVNFLQSFDGTFAGIAVTGAQLRPERNVPYKTIKRKVAVALVVAVIELAFLVSMNAIIGSVEVQYDHSLFARQGFHREIQEEVFDFSRVGFDRFVSLRSTVFDGEFEAVESGFPRERFALVAFVLASRPKWIALTAGYGEEGIVTKPVVIVEVFVAQSEAEDSLAQQFAHRMLDELRIAEIFKASGELFYHPVMLVGFAEKKRASVTGEVATLEVGDHSFGFQALKFESLLDTLCHTAVDGLVCCGELNTNTLHQTSTDRSS